MNMQIQPQKTYFQPAEGKIRQALYHVIFESEPGLGRAFDLVLIFAILGSVLAVVLESMASFREAYGTALIVVEWGFTILFSIEYIVRLLCVKRPLRYALSFFGIIDLLSVLPTFLGLLLPKGHYLMIVRVLRLLRIFRILKLTLYMKEANLLMQALRASRRKIGVFIYAVLTLVIVIGSLMYVIEGPEHGYTSIPSSIYWAIVTLTTVGYGDIAPQTPLGQFCASVVMIMGYAIIAVPTGIVTSELSYLRNTAEAERRCPDCSTVIIASDARFCRVCGYTLGDTASS